MYTHVCSHGIERSENGVLDGHALVGVDACRSGPICHVAMNLMTLTDLTTRLQPLTCSLTCASGHPARRGANGDGKHRRESGVIHRETPRGELGARRESGLIALHSPVHRSNVLALVRVDGSRRPK